MISIRKSPVPANTMLQRYSTQGAYTDCYRTEVSERVSLREYIFSFYTTPLFKLERFILELFVVKPSTDLQAQQLAEGSCDRFAAWHVEARGETELLMCDFRGRTRSWLMTIPVNASNGSQTHLYFGSAIVPKRKPETGELSLELGYQALLGFHRIYSALLLYSAKRRLEHRIRSSYDRQDQFHR